MTPLAKTAAQPVRRLGYVYLPMGAEPGQWLPGSTGTLTELSPTLSTLTPFLDQVSVLVRLGDRRERVEPCDDRGRVPDPFGDREMRQRGGHERIT